VQTEHAVDGTSCESISGYSTVSAAGALAKTDPLEITALPATSIPAFIVSPKFLNVLNVTGDGTGVWVSQQLAQTLGVSPGAKLATDIGSLTLAGTYPYPDDGRDSRLAYAVLIPASATALFDECWAQAWPPTDTNDTLLRYTATEAVADTSLQVGRLNMNHGSSFAGTSLFEHRITRFAYPLTAFIGIAVGWFAVRARRLEYAAALHARQPRVAQLLGVLLEVLVWSTLSATLAIAFTTVNLWVSPAPPGITVMSFAVAPAAVAGALLGATLALTLVREHHLFRYFKER